MADSASSRRPFCHNGDLGAAVDIGGHHVATTKKYRDVQANGWAAIVVDDLVSTDPWTPRMLEIRGRAEAIATGGADASVLVSVTPSSGSTPRR